MRANRQSNIRPTVTEVEAIDFYGQDTSEPTAVVTFEIEPVSPNYTERWSEIRIEIEGATESDSEDEIKELAQEELTRRLRAWYLDAAGEAS